MTRAITPGRVARLAIVLAATATAAGCGGVDRDATRAQMVQLVATAGATADPACVDAVLDTYSDEALKRMNAELTSKPKELTPELTTLHSQLGACITIAS